MLWFTTLFFTGIHLGCTIWSHLRNPTDQPKELVIQHHEKCFMVGLVALAILMR